MRIINKIKSLFNKGIISKKYIAKFLPENPVILEAGADTGSDTLEMLKFWPNSTIYAFEPVPESFKKLKEKTINKSSIHCYDLALSDLDGFSIMHVSNTLSSSSLLMPKEHLIQHPEISFDNKVEVKTITLENWSNSEKVEKIDFLWLDLQGSELAVLKSAGELLKNIKVIYTEVSLIENYKGAPLYNELKDYLISQGFVVKKEELPWADMGNVLFIRQ